MVMKFRARNYRLEEETARQRLPSPAPAEGHPLASAYSPSTRSSSVAAGPEPSHKLHSDCYHTAVNDPLGLHGDTRVREDGHMTLDVRSETRDDVDYDFHTEKSDELIQLSTKEWVIFTKALMQKYSHISMAKISPANSILPRNPKENERYTDVMDLQGKDIENEKRILTKQDCISRLKELKTEICHAWNSEDRNTSLKLSIRVAKFLSDTSSFQFYPMIFVSVTEILDILGELVWDRIKKKSEWTDDEKYICPVTDDFLPGDISFDAKELCFNWFSKIGAICELLPRIYLELAICRCWYFLKENPLSELQRLIMMMRGLSDPLASVYCHLYMVHCVQGLRLGGDDIGYLVTSISDMNSALRRIITREKETDSNPGLSKRSLITLMEPALEWIMRAMLRVEKQKAREVLVSFGLLKCGSGFSEIVPFPSVVLHYILKEIPGDIVLVNALELLELIDRSDDSSFEMHLNFRLLGLKLTESQLCVNHISEIVKKILPIIARYDQLDEYLDVLEAYLDIILKNKEESSLSFILDAILKKVESQRLAKNGMELLHSIIMKIVESFSFLENVLAQKNFIKLFDLLNGDLHITACRGILCKATRDTFINDPGTIQFLFEVSRVLHDSVCFSYSKDSDYAIPALIFQFIRKVEFSDDMEANLQFLVECRLTFRDIQEIKIYLVHSSNYLATKAINNVVSTPGFVKACVAFSEVSILSITNRSECLNLYLETAEVALAGGFISHAEENVFSAIKCLESNNLDKGANASNNASWEISSLLKICGILVMVPCTDVESAFQIPQALLSAVDSQPWPTLAARVKVQCAIIFLLSTFLQKEPPYRSSNPKMVGNDVLYFGDESYGQTLALNLNLAAEELVELIEKSCGSTDAVLGKLALDMCNCLAISFQGGEQLSSMFSKMMKVAESCLHPHDKYLQSTIAFLSQSNCE